MNKIDEFELLKNCRPESKIELWSLIYTNFKIEIPNKKICAEHSTPMEALWEVYNEENDTNIWWAFRGGGKTMTIALLAYFMSIHKPNCGITVLGGSFEQSSKVMDYLEKFWYESGNLNLIKGELSKTKYELVNGSWVSILTASQKSVRGPHPQKLFLDEVDEMDKDIYLASLGQPKEAYGIKPQILISSTLHNPNGLMEEIIDKGEGKIYKWCIEECLEPYGFWTKREWETKQKQLTQEMIDVEYKLKRPSFRNSVFDYQQLENAYKNEYELGIMEAGIDWGYKETVLSLFSVTKEKIYLVKSFVWNYVELSVRCEEIKKLVKEYKITNIYADSNPNDSNIELAKVLRDENVNVIPVAFSVWKKISINVIRWYLEKKQLIINDLETKRNLQAYSFKEGTEEPVKEDDHRTDSVISFFASKYQKGEINV